MVVEVARDLKGRQSKGLRDMGMARVLILNNVEFVDKKEEWLEY